VLAFAVRAVVEKALREADRRRRGRP